MFNLTNPIIAFTLFGLDQTKTLALVALAAFIVFRLVNTDKVKALFSKKPVVATDYNYGSLSASMKVIHDHVNKVGNEDEKQALDSLVRLIMKSGEK